ncbi:hypothetical protein [Amycolatopsis thermophila]|uniref:Uncharacterized protein n=1 Tax=Amycolatopsis thermophila TaxID=206084 RepID=A0ABU0EPM0_9PSEU|nr:hypothetical protein [Amycolatopsis thermophila]MDQ0377231.1 hypothetical protein [Amycolatopsis thermophila]
MSDDMADTDELELAAARGRNRAARWWRGFTGSLAAGLVALAVLVLGAGVLCAFLDVPGPGAEPMIAHPVAAALALLAQRVADRRNGPVAGVAGLLVVAVLAVALWTFWWS